MTRRVYLFGSVGRGGMNLEPDVVAVQTLLNQYLASRSTRQLLATNGTADNATIDTIVAFQREVVGRPNPDGRVDRNGPTLRHLIAQTPAIGRRSLPSFQRLWNAYPNGNPPCDQGYENQCAIRMSVTLISTGFPLTGYNGNVCRHGHARGAEPLARYISQVVGMPARASKDAGRRQWKDRSGLVFFRNIEGFRNSQGDHIDLWNGRQTQHGEYFMESQEVWFWPVN